MIRLNDLRHRVSGFILSLLVACAAMAATAATVQAQAFRAATISPLALRQAGLEMVWQTHVVLDSARGEISYVTTDLNGTNARTVFDVVDAQGQTLRSFQAGSLDARGRAVDQEGARRLADLETRVLHELGTQAQVQERLVPELVLFVQTSQGTIEAIDAETGHMRWTLSPGNRRYPNQKPGVSDRYAAIINGSTLYLYDLQRNLLAWQRGLGGAPGAGAAVSDRFVYVPLLSGMIEWYSLDEPPSPKAIVASSGRAMIQPTVSPRALSWGTDEGYFYGVDPINRTPLFRYVTGSIIASPSVYFPPDRLLVASTDGFIHCLREKTGTLLWRFSCGEPVAKPPLVVENGVYVTTDHGTLYRIHVADGRQLWSIDNIHELLSASDTVLYGRDHRGDLVVVDIEHGAKLATVPLRGWDLSVFNALTDRVYLGTTDGRLMCLRPSGHPWPMLHAAAQQELDAAQAKLAGAVAADAPAASQEPQTPADAAPAEPAQPPVDPDFNPFATPVEPGSLFESGPDDAGNDADAPPGEDGAGGFPFFEEQP